MKEHPEINYPCMWGYTVIGRSAEAMRASLVSLLAGKKYTIHFSKKSLRENYCSLRITVEVTSEAERIDLYNKLKHEGSIQVVL